jgi:hypothetical protein
LTDFVASARKSNYPDLGGFSMLLIAAALLVSAQTPADQQASQPAPPAEAASAAPAPKKVKKICKADEATSGTRMAKRLCLTEGEWAQRGHSMTDSARSGFSGKAEDH